MCAGLGQDWLAGADQAVAVANDGGHMGDLVAFGLALVRLPPSRLKASMKNDAMKWG